MNAKRPADGEPRHAPDKSPRRSKTIRQGFPTYAEPSQNKGGQNGAPKPDGRSPAKAISGDDDRLR